MGYLKNIKKQYIISFFNSLIPAYVIERLFWQQRGMNVQMVVYCEIIYALTVVILEIPSGILADKFGRKRLIAICNGFSIIEIIVILYAHNFLQFALAVFISGIGKAFSSGSQNALLYDSLQTANKQEDFEKIMGRMSAIDFAGSTIAALSGSILAKLFNFEFNYIISIISTIIAFIITLSLKEPSIITKPESEFGAMRQYANEALSVFKLKPLVFLYCLTAAVLGSCMIYLDEFWQIVLDKIGVSFLFFGIISALELSIRIPGNLFAYKLKKRFSFKKILICIVILSGTCYLSIYFIQNILCIVPMLIICVLSGITDPLIAGYLHHHTKSHIRATVESFSSFGLRLISILIGFAFGYVSTNFSIFSGFAFLGVFCFLYLILLVKKIILKGD